jgi:hypothetical protein
MCPAVRHYITFRLDWKNQGKYGVNGLLYLSLGMLSENIYRGISSGPKKGR